MTNPDQTETAQWWSALLHHSPALLAGTFTAKAVVSAFGWWTWPLVGTVTMLLAAMVLYTKHAFLGPLQCSRCMSLLAAVDDAEVERHLWSLWAFHWLVLRGVLLGVGALAMASAFIPDPLGNLVLAGCDLVLAYHFWTVDTHRRLTPWCPWCRRRWGGGGGDSVPVDEPVPTGSGSRS